MSLLFSYPSIEANSLKLHSKEKEEQKGENITLREMASIFKKKDPMADVFTLPSIGLIVKLANTKEKIERELRIIRKKEMKRIFKEFIENNYENRYHASVETVIGFSRGTK